MTIREGILAAKVLMVLSTSITFTLGVIHLVYTFWGPKLTAFRSQRGVPGLLVRSISAIAKSATMARDLPTHRGCCSMEMSGDLTNR